MLALLAIKDSFNVIGQLYAKDKKREAIMVMQLSPHISEASKNNNEYDMVHPRAS